ncbi:MAG: DNA polymerase III subunit beta [Clostridia bacterium]
MDFVCQRDDFARGITTVERAVSTKDNMPILEGIYIRAHQDGLQLIATDLEMSIECSVPARVEREGAAVLSGKVLGQIVRKFAGSEVTYRTAENGVAELASGRSRFSVHTMPEDEFPALPEVDDEEMWRIPQGALRRMIRHTAFASAADESRPFLTGVLIEVDGDELRLVATDSNRLAFHKGKLSQGAVQPRSGIVPVRALVELMRILDADEDSEVEFVVSHSQAVFRAPGVQMISRVIEGQFPDYRRVFPGQQPTRLRVDRAELLAAVERVSLIARRSTPVVRLSVSGNNLSLTSREAEVGHALEELAVVKEGDDQEAAYQSRYLAEALRAMDSDEVEVGLGHGLRQGSIAPVGDENYLYIVMPVRVG